MADCKHATSFNSWLAPITKRSLDRNTLPSAVFESVASARLTGLELNVLKSIKARSRTEKQLSKMVQIDLLVLSPIVTDLMLKGYLETARRRRLYFFTREYCCITAEGLVALEKSKTPIQDLAEFIKNRTLEAVDSFVAGLPILRAAVFSAKTIYRVAKAVG